MVYHNLILANIFYEIINSYLATNIRRGVHYCDLMDRECNYLNPFKVNIKCIYEGKFRKKWSIYEEKFTMCDSIYIGNNQQTSKKIWTVIYPMSSVFSKKDRNYTHLLPITGNTLNLLCHALTWISVWN